MKQPFAKRFNAPRLSPEQAVRQGRASQSALAALGQFDAVIGFLNTHDETLGGRPLDVAMASDAGLSAVESLLAARKQA